MNQRCKNGFTLVELSVVLVIISLIVAGILIGRDLIRSAEVRRQVSQLESFETAANAFKSNITAYLGIAAKQSSWAWEQAAGQALTATAMGKYITAMKASAPLLFPRKCSISGTILPKPIW